MRDVALPTPEPIVAELSASSSSSSEEDEAEVELLDSAYKIDGALQQQQKEQLSSTASEESGNQSEEGGAVSRDDVEQLRRTNEHLRREVADLSSALLARDLELAGLRERCQFLSTAVEQQDEVIAKIYAATATGSLPAGSALRNVEFSSSSKINEKSSTFSSMKSYPGAVGMAEPAQKLLEARLDSMGFQGDSVEKAVDSLREKFPTELEKLSEDVVSVDLGQLPYTPRAPSSSNNFGATASVYSSSSTATASSSSSSSLFGDVGEPVSKPPRSWTSPRSISIVKRRPSLERQDSSPTEEVFARSAGFLRKSNRTMSGRLSVSDLGLLDNDDDEDVESNQASEVVPFSDPGRLEKSNRDQDDCLGFADSGSSTVSSRSRSQRNLFADVDEALKSKSKQKGFDSDPASGDKADEDSLTYGEFLQRVSLPASRDILDKIRMFVGSILGPRGDGRAPRSTDYVEFDFYGKHEFRRRCNRFFETMEEILLNHPAWRHASEAKLAKARDGIEKYVMDKVSDIAYNQLKECQQWVKEDEALLRRMQLLSFITPAMLDIKPCMRNEVVWSMAEDELRRINSFRSPGDKINCIVRCCSVIFSVLNLSRGDSGSRPGADDFLPVFIYIVLHSQIPRLHSNCEYISAYRNQADLMSKAGYCFVNLRSAIEFIMVMDGSMLSLSGDEFQRLYSEREKIVLKS
ncbi:hypothetical protein PF010_g3806 [Phytophthora fragariae]|uniref:VPS9 domain-containing protein n=1 Tax=Phytophthora fragariae TaxID=53985 RepID=A0A6G0PKN3_9STRA|nr:hypothetical protein PF010_g3806 [Phytophthora fragariae]KAE9248585.1 hypothetical protein PF004_g3787 [Phytophthora fragariae]